MVLVCHCFFGFEGVVGNRVFKELGDYVFGIWLVGESCLFKCGLWRVLV